MSNETSPDTNIVVIDIERLALFDDAAKSKAFVSVLARNLKTFATNEGGYHVHLNIHYAKDSVEIDLKCPPVARLNELAVALGRIPGMHLNLPKDDKIA